MGWLNRMTQWKSKSKQPLDEAVQVTAVPNLLTGLFIYPILMAADILLYKATHVPVGEDQTQHLELARQVARAFNARGTDFFPLPAVISTEATRIMSLKSGTSKMSKSDPLDASRINLTDSRDIIFDKLKRAKTDAIPEIYFDPKTRPEISNLLQIYASLKQVTPTQAAGEFSQGKMTVFKDAVAEAIVAKICPIGDELRRIEKDPGYVDSVLLQGGEKARGIAEENMKEVRRLIGFTL